METGVWHDVGARRRAVGKRAGSGCMPEAHDMVLRWRVLADIARGFPARQAAIRAGVSASSAARWARLKARTGSVEPGRGGGRGRRMLRGQREWLLAQVAARPGITLAELRAGLRARGVEASRDTVWRFLREEGLGVGERGGRLLVASRIGDPLQ